MRTVVVGASSGLGRSIAAGLGQRGAGGPAGAAPGAPGRRGQGGRARDRWPSPATSPTRSRAQTPIEEAAKGLGGIDALIYATGIGPLGRSDRHRCRNLAANVRHQRHRSGDGHGGGHPPFDRPRGAPPPTCRRSAARYPAVAGARGLRHQQGRPRDAGGSLAGRAPAGRIHPGHRGRLRRGRGANVTGFADSWDWDRGRRDPPIWERRNLLAGR